MSRKAEVGPQDNKRAKSARRPAPPASRRRAPSAQWGTTTLFAIPAFALLVLALAIVWKLPVLVPLAYVGASLVTFLAYVMDKSAAARGAWRTPEATLHLLALAGGWPGALVAQQFLRHKSVKPEFRFVFWGTVVLNVAALVLLCSPLGRALWTRA